MPSNNLRVIQSSIPGPLTDNLASGGLANRMGIQVMQDFYTYSALLGAGFQVRAGTIATPLVGDVPITDTRCEMCADAVAGTTMIPVGLGIGYAVGSGTNVMVAIKSVATVSSAGTAFVPLPLKSNGSAAVTTARVAAHAVTVTAELATTTLRHFEYANSVVIGAGNDGGGLAIASAAWNPKAPPILVGPRCIYMQAGASTTGPSYYAHLDYLEFPTASLL